MKDLTKLQRHNEAGSAMLYIMVGIILFAALVFTMSRQTSYDTGATEKAAITAQSIISYADKVNVAVQNLMMQNGCTAAQISFANTKVAGYTNGTNKACQIFDQSGFGGGMAFQEPPAEAIDTVAAASGAVAAGNYIFEGNICVTGAGSSCTASGTTLVLLLPWVTPAVCAQINNITSNSTDIPTVAAATFDGTKFTGTFASTYTLTTSGTTNTSGCFSSSSSPPGTGYHFYSVLVAN